MIKHFYQYLGTNIKLLSLSLIMGNFCGLLTFLQLPSLVHQYLNGGSAYDNSDFMDGVLFFTYAGGFFIAPLIVGYLARQHWLFWSNIPNTVFVVWLFVYNLSAEHWHIDKSMRELAVGLLGFASMWSVLASITIASIKLMKRETVSPEQIESSINQHEKDSIWPPPPKH